MTSARWMNAIRPLLLTCIALAAAMVVTPAVNAQGTSGTLPDPISTPELDRYAAILNLSDQQRQAIEPMHNRYLKQFQQLRTDEIEDFLEQFRGLRRQMFQPEGFDAIKDATRRHRRIMARIESLDSSLFNEIQTVLSDEQTTLLPRARMARARQRYSSNAIRFATSRNPAARVDLLEEARAVDLPAEDRQAIEPVLERYERQLTRELKQLFEQATSMFEEIADRLGEAGIAGADRDNPEAMRETFQLFRQAWQDVNAEMLEEASQISELNRSTMRTMVPLMSEDGARTLRNRYYRRAYRTVMRSAGGAGQRISAALELAELTAGQREQIQELARSYDSRFAGIMNQAIDVLEAFRKQPRGFRPDRDADSSEQKIEQFRNRLSELDERTIAQLDELLGEELVAALKSRKDDGGGDGVGTTRFVAVGGADGQVIQVDGEIELETQGPTGDPYLPGPITRSDLSSYMKRLDISEARRPIIESIYAQYVDEFASIRAEYVDPLLELNQRRRPERRERGGWRVNTPEPDAVARMYELRRSGMKAVLALDETFFDDIELLISDDDAKTQQLSRIEQSRLREAYNRGGGRWNVVFAGGGRFSGRFGNGGQEERVDLTRELEDVELSKEAVQRTDSILNEYANAMTEAFRRKYEASLRLAEARQQIFAKAMAERADDEDADRRRMGRMIGEEMQRLSETVGEQAEQVTQQIIEMNRQTLEQLTEALPEPFSGQVRDAYYRAGYPGVYNDRNSAQRQMDTALNLRDLSADQRGKLIDIASEYRGQYDALCVQMVEAQMNQPEPSDDDGPGRSGWQRMRDLQNELERLRFQRRELNAKTIRRIRSVLNEQQIDRVPGLSDDDSDQ